MQEISGRTAFVTGGANGLGFGLARELLSEGCKVAIVDIREDAISAALQKLDDENVIGIPLDVSSRSGMAAAADEAEARLGPVSLLFNNAGVNLFQTIDESSYEDWDWVMGVNLHGVINGVMTFVPRMKDRGIGGHIVNTASMASFFCGPQAGIYHATKFAVRGLSESLRYSLAPHGIGVSVHCPGLIKSIIYASNDVRPAAFGTNAQPLDTNLISELEQMHQYGMEPSILASRVIDGIRANRTYIFSHPEFRDEIRQLSDEVLSDFRDYPEDPGCTQRVEMENARRDAYRAIRANSR